MESILVVEYFSGLGTDDVLEGIVTLSSCLKVLVRKSRCSGHPMVVFDEGLLDVNCHCKWGLRKAEVEVGFLQVT